MNLETFAPLTELDFLHHAFTQRTTADTRAADYESRLATHLGYAGYVRADQPHGAGVAVADCPTNITGADALITNVRKLPLVVRCADCAAIYVVDCKARVIGLIHSGKKGTLANIAGQTVAAMTRQFGTQPHDCRVLISPSIGPCHYEMDLWHAIESQFHVAGVTDIHNPRTCTACHLERYFSYRAEHGQTGRMFALLALR